MRINPSSLHFKLILASTLVEALMLSILLFNSMRLIDDAILASTDATLQQTVPMLNVATAPYLVQGDYATLQDNLNEILGNASQGVVYVVVRDSLERVVAKAGVADPNALPAASQDPKDALSGAVLHIERPVSLAGQHVGTLRFGLSTSIIAQAKTQLLRQSSAIALAEIAITFVLLSVLAYWLARNLLKFVDTSRAIADGHYNIRLSEAGRDEVATLARNFNRMAEAVASKMEELRASEQRYRELNEQLEARVEQRTQELRLAMNQIVESEKLASLGRIVAVVAHELNTPIGNVILMSTAIQDKSVEFSKLVESDKLTRSMLTRVAEDMQGASAIITRSAQRAGELVQSFKRVAVDQTSQRRRSFDLRLTLEDIVHTLSTMIRRANVSVELLVPTGIVLDSYPGHLDQIFNNLILNSIKHGFDGMEAGHIVVEGRVLGDGVEIVYRDDGRGIAKEILPHVFEPFFTTTLVQGGSGLGMFVVHNLVCGALRGSIQLDSEPGQGVRFVISIPRVTP